MTTTQPASNEMRVASSYTSTGPARAVDFTLATEEYDVFVRTCADMDLAIDIPNRHIDHAAVLENNILRLTKNGVDILTGTFPELFFDKIHDEFESALHRDVTVRLIIVDCEPCAAIIALRAQYTNLKLFTLRKDAREEISRKVRHFMVSDKKRFRLEERHEKKDFSIDPSVKATATFNNPTGASALQDAFNTLLEFSELVS